MVHSNFCFAWENFGRRFVPDVDSRFVCKELYEAVKGLGGPLREINFSQLFPKQGELKFISEGFSSGEI